MGKSSGGTKTIYEQSPEQQAVFQALLPMFQGLSQQGVSNLGMTNMGAPSAPTAPSMTGILSGVPQYQIPNVNSMMPTQDWWNSLSPDVMQGIWAPYQQASKGMLEQLGGMGQLGSARGGATGAAGAALGQFGADAANKVGLQAWQMSQPAMQAGWNAQLAQNQQGYGNQLTEANTNYQNQISQQNKDYATAMQAWGLPFGLTGQIGGTYSQGITTQPSSGMGGMFGGMLTGGLAGGMMGQQSGNTGYGAAGGGLLGGLGGLMGGK
jgi:hypothetical protein